MLDHTQIAAILANDPVVAMYCAHVRFDAHKVAIYLCRRLLDMQTQDPGLFFAPEMAEAEYTAVQDLLTLDLVDVNWKAIAAAVVAQCRPPATLEELLATVAAAHQGLTLTHAPTSAYTLTVGDVCWTGSDPRALLAQAAQWLAANPPAPTRRIL